MGATDRPPRTKPIALPAIRDRFVMRARHLKAFPPFREMLERERAAWDARFPQFAIGRPSLPPDETMAEYGPYFPAYPPSLSRGITEINALSGKERREHPDYDAICDAANEWLWLVLRLAKEWWPADVFPVWTTGGTGHPAGAFVSACLVWRLQVVSENWIVKAHLAGPVASAYNPERGEHPTAVFWRAYATAMDEAYRAAAESGAAMGIEELRRLQRRAHDEANEREREASPKDIRDWFYYVPVYPGMTSTDWRAMEPWVIKGLDARFGPNPLARHAKRLREEGLSARRIAIELGVSERHAGRLLDVEDPEPPASSHEKAGGQDGADPRGGAGAP